MPIDARRRLHQTITDALDEADRLGLADVGIGLDRARIALTDDLAMLLERRLLLTEPLGEA